MIGVIESFKLDYQVGIPYGCLARVHKHLVALRHETGAGLMKRTTTRSFLPLGICMFFHLIFAFFLHDNNALWDILFV